MKISLWQIVLFIGLILGVSWVVFPGPRDLVGIYAQDNKREQAEKMLEKLLAKSPNDPDLNQAMAELAYENGDIDKALSFLGKVLQLRPERLEQLLRLAQWREEANQPEAALESLELALTRMPAADARRPETVASRREVLLRLLDFYGYLGRNDEAAATVQRLLPLDRLALAKELAGGAALAQASAELERLAAAPAPRAEDPVFKALLVDAYVARRMYLDDLADGQGGPERERFFVSDSVDLFVRASMLPEALRLAQAYDKATKSATARMAVAQALAGYGADKDSARLMAQLLAENPKDTTVLAALAEHAMNINEPAEAVKHLTRLCELAPADVPARRRLGEALLAAGRAEDAFAVLAPLPVDGTQSAITLLSAAETTNNAANVEAAARSVQGLARSDAAVGIRLADAWLAVNRAAEAWPILRAFAADSGGDPELIRKAIQAAAQTGNPAIVREVLALVERQDRIDAAMLLDVANILADGGELNGAAIMYGRYLARAPGDLKTALRLAEVHSWRGAPDMAFAVLEGLLKSRPDDLALLRKAAGYAEEAGKDKDAFRVYAAIYRKAPKDKGARENFLRLAEWTGNSAESAKLLAEDSEREPKSLHKARQAAEAYLAADEPKKALPLLERALALAPGDMALRRSLADTLGGLGFVDRQAAALEPLAALGVLSEDEAVLVAGRMLERKQPQRALDVLRAFENLTPLPWDAGTMLVQAYTLLNRTETTQALMRRLKSDYQSQPARLTAIGDLAVLHKKMDFALECYAAALKADPRNSAAIKGTAQVHAWNNDSARAIKGFETYRVRRPEDMEARYQLGELYYSTDRQGDAYGEYKKTLKLIREAREARKVRDAKPADGRPTP